MKVIATDKKGQKVSKQVDIEVGKSPFMILDSGQILPANQGFNVDERNGLGDPTPDNAISSMAAMVNPAFKKNLSNSANNTDPITLLMEAFGPLNSLKSFDSTGNDIAFYQGSDPDNDPTDNHSGVEEFQIDASSLTNGRPQIELIGVKVDAQGNFDTFKQGLSANFVMDFPLAGGGSMKLTINPAYIRGQFVFDKTGLKIKNGVLGGAVPIAIFDQMVDLGLGTKINPIKLLASQVDVDLNNDGKLDKKTKDKTNPDGISIALSFTTVSAKRKP